MRPRKLILAAGVFGTILGFWEPAGAALPPDDGSTRRERIAFLRSAAERYGAPADVLVALARLDTENVIQFSANTFHRFAAKARAADPAAWRRLGRVSRDDWRQRALAAAWALAHDKGRHWGRRYRRALRVTGDDPDASESGEDPIAPPLPPEGDPAAETTPVEPPPPPSDLGGEGLGQACGLSSFSFYGPEAKEQNDSSEEERKEGLRCAARQYGVDERLIVEVARRESHFRVEAGIHKQGQHAPLGMLQFRPGTFRRFATKARENDAAYWGDLGDLNIWDWRQQALAAARAFSKGYGCRWSTYKWALKKLGMVDWKGTPGTIDTDEHCRLGRELGDDSDEGDEDDSTAPPMG